MRGIVLSSLMVMLGCAHGAEPDAVSRSTSDPEGATRGSEVADGTSTSSRPVCGNGVREHGEECDGADFGDWTCALLTYGARTESTLKCSPGCRIDLGASCTSSSALRRDPTRVAVIRRDPTRVAVIDDVPRRETQRD